jgi:hypothetical protein
MDESKEEKHDGIMPTIIIEVISFIDFILYRKKRALMMIVVIRPRERESEEKKSSAREKREREHHLTNDVPSLSYLKIRHYSDLIYIYILDN